MRCQIRWNERLKFRKSFHSFIFCKKIIEGISCNIYWFIKFNHLSCYVKYLDGLCLLNIGYDHNKCQSKNSSSMLLDICQTAYSHIIHLSYINFVKSSPQSYINSAIKERLPDDDSSIERSQMYTAMRIARKIEQVRRNWEIVPQSWQLTYSTKVCRSDGSQSLVWLQNSARSLVNRSSLILPAVLASAMFNTALSEWLYIPQWKLATNLKA